MKKAKIESIIKELRIRPRSSSQDRLANILAAHDRWQQIHCCTRRSRYLRVRWTAGLVSAAIMILVISLVVTSKPPQHHPTHEGRTMAVPQYQINTAGSLQRTFCQEGLEGLERQLDQAFDLYGPGPAVPPDIDLF